MFIKLFLGICILNSIEAIFLIKLPTEEVDKIHGKLAAEKPHVLLSPNDAAQSPLNLESIENSHHGNVAALDAKNLVDLAESLNLTILVKALEETGLDNIIDHEGNILFCRKTTCLLATTIHCICRKVYPFRSY